jgi:hypothetical protein
MPAVASWPVISAGIVHTAGLTPHHSELHQNHITDRQIIEQFDAARTEFLTGDLCD